MMNERTFVFGTNNSLIGTLTLPDEARVVDANVGFLLFNAGVIHRIGPHRINVRLARQLAARGIPSLRFDLAGHGDSARQTGEYSFEEQAVVDLRSAMDALGDAAKLKRFAIFGFCSGAYYGLDAALADERVTGLFMLDAYRYPTLRTQANYGLYRLQQPRALQAMLGAVQRGGTSLLRRLGSAPSGSEPELVPELGRIDFVPSREEVASRLKKLLARGVAIRVIYSGGYPREYNYPRQFEDTFGRFGITRQIQAEFLPNLDHTATVLSDQADLMGRIVAWGADLMPNQAAT
jgi:pimeloyl-ACP methyl ester carboxylesterase